MSATRMDQVRKVRKVSGENSLIHQKDFVNNDDFEPYPSSQTNQMDLRGNRHKVLLMVAAMVIHLALQ
uniref:Uncharacterized protein n=1 Tax=Vombatus ursinus TaxID=29139 RepID=A0A4X2JSQ6_VOMUR